MYKRHPEWINGGYEEDSITTIQSQCIHKIYQANYVESVCKDIAECDSEVNDEIMDYLVFGTSTLQECLHNVLRIAKFYMSEQEYYDWLVED